MQTVIRNQYTNYAYNRPYLKGRDWYDFLYYARKKIQPNYLFLKNAVDQMGAFKKKEMRERIQQIDWVQARRDHPN